MLKCIAKFIVYANANITHKRQIVIVTGISQRLMMFTYKRIINGPLK